MFRTAVKAIRRYLIYSCFYPCRFLQSLVFYDASAAFVEANHRQVILIANCYGSMFLINLAHLVSVRVVNSLHHHIIAHFLVLRSYQNGKAFGSSGFIKRAIVSLTLLLIFRSYSWRKML